MNASTKALSQQVADLQRQIDSEPKSGADLSDLFDRISVKRILLAQNEHLAAAQSWLDLRRVWLDARAVGYKFYLNRTRRREDGTTYHAVIEDIFQSYNNPDHWFGYAFDNGSHRLACKIVKAASILHIAE